jgi:hypothetical protein
VKRLPLSVADHGSRELGGCCSFTSLHSAGRARRPSPHENLHSKNKSRQHPAGG